MILNVRCRMSLCGVRKIFHPYLCAMSKSPLLNGSAMFALLGTLSRIWCNWHLLCHVQCAPMMLLSWLMFACSFNDGMFRGFVVAQLTIRMGQEWLEQDWCDDGCPGFEEVYEGLGGGELVK